jgi:hypothetical protein
MAITNGYCTLAQLKGRLGITDSTSDTDLEDVIEGVSRFIDNDRRRVFYTTTAEARYWTPKHSDRLWIDDAVSISAVEVATSTSLSYTAWASTDYLTVPFNTTPVMCIHVHPASGKYFVRGLLKSAKITGTWGYASSTPNEIQQATILLAQYVWLRKDAPLGTAGLAFLGEIAANPSLMPSDIKGLINSVPIRVGH